MIPSGDRYEPMASRSITQEKTYEPLAMRCRVHKKKIDLSWVSKQRPSPNIVLPAGPVLEIKENYLKADGLWALGFNDNDYRAE